MANQINDESKKANTEIITVDETIKRRVRGRNISMVLFVVLLTLIVLFVVNLDLLNKEQKNKMANQINDESKKANTEIITVDVKRVEIDEITDVTFINGSVVIRQRDYPNAKVDDNVVLSDGTLEKLWDEYCKAGRNN